MKMDNPRFQNYPGARKGPDEPYKKEDLALPVLRGRSLSIGAAVYVHYYNILPKNDLLTNSLAYII